MKVANFRPSTRADIPAADPWMDDALKPVNRQIQDLTSVVQGKGNIYENLNNELLSLEVEHLKWNQITFKTLRGEAIGAICIYSTKPRTKEPDLEIGDGWLKVRFTFDGAPTGKVFVRILAIGA